MFSPQWPSPRTGAAANRSAWIVALALPLLLIVTAWAFHPGLGGSYIFDDAPNLQPWADLGDINSLQKALTFTFSSKFFPGRPLSLLSFLIDDQSWPADISLLKRTNLALHLINTCLVLWLALQLMCRLLPPGKKARAPVLALFVAAIWALHPLQVSNVSYVIQRMNLLETTLALSALLMFMAGRERLGESLPKALTLASISIGIGMPLALLAKENGLLICAFALLIEGFCFDTPAPLAWRLWKLIFLWGPLAAFVAYCLVTYHGFTTGYEIRNFNAWERLLSEGPVLADYLYKLLLPHMHGSGLFFDNFPISRHVSDPRALICWLLITGLLTTAFLLRRRAPLVSFGIFFYFCGHLMESTVLPLELYFEHRNYLPQAGLWLAVAGLMSTADTRWMRRIQIMVAVIWIALLAIMSHSNAALWSQPDLQTTLWYRENPGSLRNILAYSNFLLRKGAIGELDGVLAKGARLYPNSLEIAVSQKVASCYGQDKPTRFDDLPTLARHADYGTGGIVLLERLRRPGPQRDDGHGCRRLDSQQTAAIYLGLLGNPKYRYAATALLGYLAEISLEERNTDSAAGYYLTAFTRGGDPIYGYHAAYLLAAMGYKQAARDTALRARNRVNWRIRLQHPDLLPLLGKVLDATSLHTPPGAP